MSIFVACYHLIYRIMCAYARDFTDCNVSCVSDSAGILKRFVSLHIHGSGGSDWLGICLSHCNHGYLAARSEKNALLLWCRHWLWFLANLSLFKDCLGSSYDKCILIILFFLCLKLVSLSVSLIHILMQVCKGKIKIWF